MKTATKSDLLACKLKIEAVPVPGFKVRVFVREFNMAQRDEWFELIKAAITNKKIEKNREARVLLQSIVDENSKQLFTIEEAEKFADISPQVFYALERRALELSGLLPESLALEKKSWKTIQNIDSASNWLKDLVRRSAR
jgi:uncharacterized SAM-binding protein YcdF (DUF218 family)